MKKFIIPLLMLLSATNAFADNLVINSGLTWSGSADQPDNWQNWSTTASNKEESLYHTAAPSIKFWWNMGIYQDITTTWQVGDMIEFGGWFYQPDFDPLTGDKHALMEIECFESNGDIIKNGLSIDRMQANSPVNTWVYLYGYTFIPPNTTKVRILGRMDVVDGGGSIYMDDLSLHIIAGSPTSTPTLTATVTPTPSPTDTSSPTKTFTITYTYTNTPSMTNTQSPTPTISPSYTVTASLTNTPICSPTPTATITPTWIPAQVIYNKRKVNRSFFWFLP